MIISLQAAALRILFLRFFIEFNRYFVEVFRFYHQFVKLFALFKELCQILMHNVLYVHEIFLDLQ